MLDSQHNYGYACESQICAYLYSLYFDFSSRKTYELIRLGELIKQARKDKNTTQEDLGKFIGVKKSTISKLERHAKNVTIDTILRVFDAVKANIRFNIEFENSANLELI